MFVSWRRCLRENMSGSTLLLSLLFRAFHHIILSLTTSAESGSNFCTRNRRCDGKFAQSMRLEAGVVVNEVSELPKIFELKIRDGRVLCDERPWSKVASDKDDASSSLGEEEPGDAGLVNEGEKATDDRVREYPDRNLLSSSHSDGKNCGSDGK